MIANKVAFFRLYPFEIGQKVHIDGGPRNGDWEVVGINEKKIKLQCPISQRIYEWDRFCFFVEERDGIKWPDKGNE
ncbi:MAG: hypothetical protein ACMUIP_08360 [bacterium]